MSKSMNASCKSFFFSFMYIFFNIFRLQKILNPSMWKKNATTDRFQHSSQAAVHLTRSLWRGSRSHFLHPQVTEKCQSPSLFQTPSQVHFFQTTTLTGSPAYPDYREKGICGCTVTVCRRCLQSASVILVVVPLKSSAHIPPLW